MLFLFYIFFRLTILYNLQNIYIQKKIEINKNKISRSKIRLSDNLDIFIYRNRLSNNYRQYYFIYQRVNYNKQQLASYNYLRATIVL